MGPKPQTPSTQPTTEKLTQAEIDEKSWYEGIPHSLQPDIRSSLIDEHLSRKYLGYRSFARFAASDTDFFVLRRFDYLNARVLLTLQDQLSALEEELEALEANLMRKDAEDIDNGTLRPDPVPRRSELIALISEKTEKYSENTASTTL